MWENVYIQSTAIRSLTMYTQQCRQNSNWNIKCLLESKGVIRKKTLSTSTGNLWSSFQITTLLISVATLAVANSNTNHRSLWKKTTQLTASAGDTVAVTHAQHLKAHIFEASEPICMIFSTFKRFVWHTSSNHTFIRFAQVVSPCESLASGFRPAF